MGGVAIIGFGCAGYHVAKTLRENGYDGVIDVFSNTNEAPYNPMLTTYYVSGKIEEEGLFPFGSLEEICNRFSLNVFSDCEVSHLYAGERVVETKSGKSEPYDYIVISTGASAVVPPFARELKNNCYTMRTVDDARKLKEKLDTDTVESAVVVGGQMVGIKVVELLWKRNIKTILIDMAPHIFPTSAFESFAQVIQQILTERGIEQYYACPLTSVEETENGILSTFGDDLSAETNIILFCAGIRSNLSFLDSDEITASRVITVDLHMRTSAENIYACGDCCEVQDIQTGKTSSIGLWANAIMQGETVAYNILGKDTEYQGNLIHNITHFMDMDFISIGNNQAQGQHVNWNGNGWEMEAIMGENGKPECINILDNANVSGPLKALLMKRFRSSNAALSPATLLQLQRSELPREVIDILSEDPEG